MIIIPEIIESNDAYSIPVPSPVPSVNILIHEKDERSLPSCTRHFHRQWEYNSEEETTSLPP